MEIEKLSIEETSKLVKSGELKPSQVLEYYINRIEKLNPKLNALVAHRFTYARKRAKALDELPLNELPPLAGLPFTTKEMIEVEGMPYTIGLKKRTGLVARNSASVVKRLEDNGAICIGVSNVPELGFWWETDNHIYGKTKNPHNLDRTPGGSSGGEGALVASGMTAFGIGSDIGGSIRIPASFCGIYGIKPTRRVIPITGHFPATADLVHQHSGSNYLVTTVGPMAKSAKDLMTLTKIMASPDGMDREVHEHNFDYTEKRFDGSIVYYIDHPSIKLAGPPSNEIIEATRKAALHFETLGAKVFPLDPKIFEDAFVLWSARLSEMKSNSFNRRLGNGIAPSLMKESFKFLIMRPDITFPDLVYATMEKFFKSPEKTEKNYQKLITLAKEVSELLGEKNLLIFPTHPRVAPKHHHPKFRPFDFTYTAIFNALDLPAVTVPIERSKSGLPIGVQVVANSFNDPLALWGAIALEEKFGGWINPN